MSAEDGALSADDLTPSPGLFADLTAITGDTLIGRRLSPDLVMPIPVRYAVIDGKAIYQGDIVLGDAKEIAAREALRKSDHWALILTNASDLWPSGIVPIGSDAPTARLVAKTIAYFHQFTPIQFVPATGGDYVYVQAGGGGGSSEAKIGKVGGVQVISVDPHASLGTLAHEFCHVLGLWHEQCRPDRDHYITVNYANIPPQCAAQFDIEQYKAKPSGPYDYASLMHYPGNAFAPDGKLSITRKDGRPLPLATGFSGGDVQGLKALYPGLGWR